MITNFDSTEQSQEWNDLVKQYPAYPSIRNLWCRTDTYRPCERLLNDYTDIATHFAGIVRTAYMYWGCGHFLGDNHAAIPWL